MPVPLPSDAEVLLEPPDAAEARIIAGGVAAAVAPVGGLTSLQRLIVESLIESMTGFAVPVSRVPRLGPHEFAERDGAAQPRVPPTHAPEHVVVRARC